MRASAKRIGSLGLLVILLALPGAAALAGPANPPPGRALAAAPTDLPPPQPLDRVMVSLGSSASPSQALAMSQAGVQALRTGLGWGDVEPRDGAGMDWIHFDRTVSAVTGSGIHLVIDLGGNPAWAASVPDGPVDRAPISRYYAFVTAAVTRYSAPPYNVRAWEIYNEPDVNTNWGHRAADYVQVLQQDYNIVKSIQPDAAVLIGGLGYDNFEDQGGPFVRSFLADVLAAGGGAYTDVLNVHHYNAVGSAWPNLSTMLASLLSAERAAGVAKPIYWSETGAPSDPHWGGSLASEARYVTKAFAGGLGLGIQSVAWFPLQDTDSSIWYYFNSHGLLDIAGVPKPAYTTYKVMAGYLAGAYTLRPQDGSELGGNPAAEAYNFIRADGTSVSVGWANGSTAVESWPAGHVLAVQDLYGQPLAVPQPVNGLTNIPLGDDPVYIALDRACRFGEVPWDFWARSYIESLCWQGVISGYADGTFRPYTNATRGQISKMVVLGMGWAIDTSAGQVFADVPSTNPFYGYIATAYAHGIISGYADGTFHPGANVTRGQLSKMLTLAKGWPLPQPRGGFNGDIRGRPTPTPTPTATVVPILQDFVDVPPANPFYSYIEAVYQHGVVSGYADHTFRPFNYTTRAQLSKMISLTQAAP